MTTEKKTVKRLKLTGAELDRAYAWYIEQPDAVKVAIAGKLAITPMDEGKAFTDKWLNADTAEAIRAAVSAVYSPDSTVDDVAARIFVKADRAATALDYLYPGKLAEAAPAVVEVAPEAVPETVPEVVAEAEAIVDIPTDDEPSVPQDEEFAITADIVREILEANMAEGSIAVAVDEIVDALCASGPQPAVAVVVPPLVWNPSANSVFVTLPAGVTATRAWLSAVGTNRMMWRTMGGGSEYRIPMSARAITSTAGSTSLVFGITQPDGSSRKWQIYSPNMRLELR